MNKSALSLLLLATAGLALPAGLDAQEMPTNLLPDPQETDQTGDDDAVTSSAVPVDMTSQPVVQKFDPVVQQWSLANAEALAAVIVPSSASVYSSIAL